MQYAIHSLLPITVRNHKQEFQNNQTGQLPLRIFIHRKTAYVVNISQVCIFDNGEFNTYYDKKSTKT